jgi:hypothetical protein
MSATIVYIWYLVVAGPGGGMAVMPSAFDTRDECVAAIAEYRKTPTDPGWSLQCVPSASSFMEGETYDDYPTPAGPGVEPPAEQPAQ